MRAPRDALDRAIAAWNANDLPTYLDPYDDRIALHGYSEEPMTKTDLRGFYEGIFAALSEIELEIHVRWSGRARSSAAASRCTGRTPASWRGSPPPAGASTSRA